MDTENKKILVSTIMTGTFIAISFILLILLVVNNFSGIEERMGYLAQIKRNTNQYETNLDKIKYCVQKNNGMSWFIDKNKFLCFDKEGKMTYQDETGYTE